MWKKFDQLEVMLELARDPNKMAMIKEKGGEVVYRTTKNDGPDEDRYARGNFELNLVTGLTRGRGLQVYFHHGEFYYLIIRGTDVLPEVVDIRDMEYHGKIKKVPICLIDGELYPDINSLTMRLFSEVNPTTLQQTFLWANQYTRLTRKFPGGEVKFRLSDFEVMGPHYSNHGKKSGYSFLHSKLGFISGLGELRDKFPDLQPRQVRSIYHSFDIAPSTNITKLWGPKAKEERFTKFCKKYNVYYDKRVEAVYMGKDAAISYDLAEAIGITEKEAEEFWDWVKENEIAKSTSKTSSERTKKPS